MGLGKFLCAAIVFSPKIPYTRLHWEVSFLHAVQAKSILSAQNGMNLCRGCVHGCIYCDSRSDCYQMDHPFEDVAVKENAPQLLEQALKRKRALCMIGTGAMSDPYMPMEETLALTRKCLEIIAKYGFGLAIQTKSDRILRDLPLLERINQQAKCVVQMTLTTYDESLCRILEPNVSTSYARFEALKILRDHGIPTIVWISPILPYINDTEENLRGLLSYCVEANVTGIICFGMGLTLRNGNREYFYEHLDRHFPGLKTRYIREYGDAYSLTSSNNAPLMALLQETCQTHHILCDPEAIFSYLRTFPAPFEQLSL